MRVKMRRYRTWGVTALSVFAVLCITAAACRMVFYMNDDMTMRNILSGAYSGVPDGHAVYMKYPLTGLISLLYRLTGKIPWFSAFLAGCFLLSASLVIGEMAGRTGLSAVKRWAMTVVLALLCAVLFLPNYVYLHYTVTAGMLGGCGLFLAAADSRRRAVLLFTLCYCVRSQVFFLLLPFLAVIVLWKIWEKRWKQQLILLALLSFCVLVCMVWDGMMYRTENWQRYRAYNESRTHLYDYGAVLPYEEYGARYEAQGIDEQEHVILEQYALALDRALDAEKLQAAADIYDTQLSAGRSDREFFRFCLAEYIYHLKSTDRPYNYVLAAAYLTAFLLLLQRRRWMQLLLVCCMGAGRSLIWIYLIWQGRFPERVYISLYLLEIMTLAGMCCGLASERPPQEQAGGEDGKTANACPKKMHPAALLSVSAALGVILAAAAFIQIRTVSGRVAEMQSARKEWSALTDYCQAHREDLYLLDVLSMVSYAGDVWETLRPGQSNYILAGGWMSGSPLMGDRIAEWGAQDGGSLLTQRPEAGGEVLYIASYSRDMEWLEDYLSERFGPTKMELEDSIMLNDKVIFGVYRFSSYGY